MQKKTARQVRLLRILTRHGEITVRRNYFYCAGCGEKALFLDQRLGLPEGTRTRDLDWLVGKHGVQADSFGAARELIEDSLRVNLSKSTVVNETHRQAAEHAAHPGLAPVEAAPWGGWPEAERTLYASADGVTVRTTDRDPDPDGGQVWRELAVAEVYSPGRDLDAHAVSLTTEGRVGRDLHRLAGEAGALPTPSDTEVRPLIAGVCDGGKGYQNQILRALPVVVFLLDLWHLLQNAGHCAAILHPKDPARAARWRRTVRAVAKRHGGHGLLDWLDCHKPRRPERVEAWSAFRQYVENNEAHMDYPQARALGLSLGSGSIESSCKSIVTLRMKGPGMAWSSRKAAPFANLRALHLNHRIPCPTDVLRKRAG